MSQNKNRGLGKGLGALFSAYDDYEVETRTPRERPASARPQTEEKPQGVQEISLSMIDPNPNQPRKRFDPAALEELANSIREHGVVQPIVVVQNDERYTVIAGERRFRASRLAGLGTIPAVVKNYTTQQIKEIAIIENLQREDLNPVEASRAILSLMNEHGLTQEQVATRIGKPRSSITNLLRILNLPENVVKLIEDNKLTFGHAKALGAIESPTVIEKFAFAASNDRMSVRNLEKMIKDYISPSSKAKKSAHEPSLELKALVNDMQKVFSTRVSVLGNDTKGRIFIDYFSGDDLDRIFEIIKRLELDSKLKMKTPKK
ncbi:MAG: ParB/RepB/Spo0J family partition protein [Firmicutes bacterium]|nr:ParB/RepB/Spo0J family partition protein [Bacillota bacterium]MCL2771656.1 ParB/RepB/Spo0J family partition protein [Bacillota bacterium]